MAITFHNVSKRYQKEVLSDFSATLPEQGLVLLTGPSGSGKTTMAHILLGLVPADSGRVEGADAVRFSTLFQEDRLLPWLTVEENVNAVLKEKLPREAVAKLLQAVGLSEIESLYPDELSGGMRRRVAFVRAVAFDGAVFLLDEPFSGLDAVARELVSAEILRLSKEKTVILIVHDPAPFLPNAAQVITL